VANHPQPLPLGHARENIERVLWASVRQSTLRRYASSGRGLVTWLSHRYPTGWPRLTTDIFLLFLSEMREAGYAAETARGAHKFVAKVCVVHALALPYHEPTISAFFRGYANLAEGRKRRGPIQLAGLNTLLIRARVPPIDRLDSLVCAFACVGYFALLRISEVVSLSAGDIWLGEGGLWVKAFPQKNWAHPINVCYPVGRTTLCVPPTVCDLLCSVWGADSQIARHEIGDVKQRLSALVARNFPSTAQHFFSFHSLRHGRVTDLYHALPGSHAHRLGEIANLGRWKSPGTVALYLHGASGAGHRRAFAEGLGVDREDLLQLVRALGGA
jgi:integrase